MMAGSGSTDSSTDDGSNISTTVVDSGSTVPNILVGDLTIPNGSGLSTLSISCLHDQISPVSPMIHVPNIPF